MHTSHPQSCAACSQPAYADHFNWCVVPDKGYDAILFGAMAVVVAVVLQGKYSALWTLIAGVSFDTARGYRLPTCRFTGITHLSILGLCRWCSPSISFTFQNWSCWQRHCNLAGHSTCRPLPVHLLATYACGCSSTYRLLHLPQGKPLTPCWLHMPACILNSWTVLNLTHGSSHHHTSCAGYISESCAQCRHG